MNCLYIVVTENGDVVCSSKLHLSCVSLFYDQNKFDYGMLFEIDLDTKKAKFIAFIERFMEVNDHDIFSCRRQLRG